MSIRYGRGALPPPARAGEERTQSEGSRSTAPVAAGILLAALGGCVTVEAPDKPIVIELNVNIRQEVIYRLAADARNTVEENEDIF